MNKVSVICPTFNRPILLQHTINSFLEQRCDDKELIIINDGGSKGIEKIIESYNDKQLKYFYKKNEGVGSALAYGVDHADGKFICLLPDDDLFYGEYSLTSRINKILNSNYDCIYTDVIGIDINGNKFEEYPAEDPDEKRIWQEDYINTLGMLWYKDLHNEIGNFDKNLLCNEDWDWKIRVLFSAHVGCYNFISAKYRRHREAKSTFNKQTGLREKMKKYIREKIIREYGNEYKWLKE